MRKITTILLFLVTLVATTTTIADIVTRVSAEATLRANADTELSGRITDEVNANNVETATRCELWLDSIRKGIDKANEMYGLSLAVNWRVNPKTDIKDSWEGDQNEQGS